MPSSHNRLFTLHRPTVLGPRFSKLRVAFVSRTLWVTFAGRHQKNGAGRNCQQAPSNEWKYKRHALERDRHQGPRQMSRAQQHRKPEADSPPLAYQQHREYRQPQTRNRDELLLDWSSFQPPPAKQPQAGGNQESEEESHRSGASHPSPLDPLTDTGERCSPCFSHRSRYGLHEEKGL